MKKILILLTLISFKSLSQGYINYHNLCNLGAECIEQGKYVEGKNTLLTAVNSVKEPLAIDYFNLSKCYSQLKMIDSTIIYLELSLKLNNWTKNIAKENSSFFVPTIGTERWDQILSNEYYSPPKVKKWQKRLVAKLSQLEVIDQHYRNILDSIYSYYPNDTLLIQKYNDSVYSDEELVGKELERIIRRRGWPGEKVNGYQTSIDCLLLLHLNEPWYIKMESKLIKEIDKGNLYPWCFADLSDRIRFEHKELEKYNSFLGYDNEVTSEVIENCQTIGVPLGKIRTIRQFYRMTDLY